MNKLSLDDQGVTRQVDSYIDLSAIVKGYAVDRIGELLKKQGSQCQVQPSIFVSFVNRFSFAGILD